MNATVQESDAEVLCEAMLKKPDIQSTNVDTQPFFLRSVLGHRLRAENVGKIPMLLYWHPNVDQCASTCAIPGIESKQVTRTSILDRIKTVFGVSSQPLNNEVAVAKILVSNTEPLQYIGENTLKSLLKQASIHVQRLFQLDFEKTWDERRKEINVKLPSWDVHDCQTVVAFHIPNGESSLLLNSSIKCDRVDANHHGDDGLLRLYISLEFRRALRDKLIEQQRYFNFINDQKVRLRQIEQQRLEAAEEEQREKQRIDEEKKALVNEDINDRWQYDQDDATLLQRAGGAIGGTIATTGGLVVGGASLVVGAAWSGASLAGSVATGSATSVVNIFRR